MKGKDEGGGWITLAGGLDTQEPWEGRWEGGVEVSCISREGRRIQQLVLYCCVHFECTLSSLQNHNNGLSQESQDCQLSKFSAWSSCSVSCGVGQQQRDRR